jgi:hypothetical protein
VKIIYDDRDVSGMLARTPTSWLLTSDLGGTSFSVTGIDPAEFGLAIGKRITIYDASKRSRWERLKDWLLLRKPPLTIRFAGVITRTQRDWLGGSFEAIALVDWLGGSRVYGGHQ